MHLFLYGQTIKLNCICILFYFYCRMLHAPGLVWLPSFFPRTIFCSVLQDKLNLHISTLRAIFSGPQIIPYLSAVMVVLGPTHAAHEEVPGPTPTLVKVSCLGTRCEILPPRPVPHMVVCPGIQDEGNRKENLDTAASEYQLVDNTVFSHNRQNVSLPTNTSM